jgi:hypothetical protein
VHEEPSFDIRLIETYAGVPIYLVAYLKPTILTAEKDLAQTRALLDLSGDSFSVIIDYRNLSNACDYGPEEQAKVYATPEHVRLKERAITFVRYHAVSFTSMIQTMRANMLVRSSAVSNFAPDLESALRHTRRAIDHCLERAR